MFLEIGDKIRMKNRMKQVVGAMTLILIILTSVSCTNEVSKEQVETGTAIVSEERDTEDSEDSLSQIEGILWEANGDTGVVFSHGAIYDAKSWEDQALALVGDNMASFAVEDISSDQLIAAGKLLKEQKGLNKIILIGASAGGATAIEAVNKEPGLFDKIILLSPVGNPTSIEEIPLLVVFSEEEGYENLLESTANNLDLLVIPGSAHAQRLFNEDESSKMVMEKILAFIRE